MEKEELYGTWAVRSNETTYQDFKIVLGADGIFTTIIKQKDEKIKTDRGLWSFNLTPFDEREQTSNIIGTLTLGEKNYGIHGMTAYLHLIVDSSRLEFQKVYLDALSNPISPIILKGNDNQSAVILITSSSKLRFTIKIGVVTVWYNESNGVTRTLGTYVASDEVHKLPFSSGDGVRFITNTNQIAQVDYELLPV